MVDLTAERTRKLAAEAQLSSQGTPRICERSGRCQCVERSIERGSGPAALGADTADPRSHAKITLEAVEAVIEGRATKDQENYSIAGRSLSRTPVADLLSLRDYYRTEFLREQRVERRNNGIGTGARILARFS